MDRQLKKLMNMTVGYEKCVKLGSNGDKLYADVITLAHVYYLLHTLVVTTASGQQVVSNYTIYIDCNDLPTISSNDKFAISDVHYGIKSFAPLVNDKGKNEVWEVHV